MTSANCTGKTSLLTPVLSAQRSKKKSGNGTQSRRSHVSSHGMSTGVATPLTKIRASRGRRDFNAAEKRKGALEDKFNKLFNAITQEKDQLRAKGISMMNREMPRSTSEESLCAGTVGIRSQSRSPNPHLKSQSCFGASITQPVLMASITGNPKLKKQAKAVKRGVATPKVLRRTDQNSIINALNGISGSVQVQSGATNK